MLKALALNKLVVTMLVRTMQKLIFFKSCQWLTLESTFWPKE